MVPVLTGGVRSCAPPPRPAHARRWPTRGDHQSRVQTSLRVSRSFASFLVRQRCGLTDDWKATDFETGRAGLRVKDPAHRAPGGASRRARVPLCGFATQCMWRTRTEAVHTMRVPAGDRVGCWWLHRIDMTVRCALAGTAQGKPQ